MTATGTAQRARLDLRQGTQRTFAHVVASALVVSVVNFTLWFAVTFWVYLETRSVFATGLIAGVFLVATASTGIWFGSIVDHHRKQSVLQLSAVASFVLYSASLAIYLMTPAATFRDPASPVLWTFVVVLMLGVIAGNLRSIALPTMVTLLVPEPVRDKANGLVGTASGVSFLVTSVISGLLVAYDGMRSVLLLALVVLAVSFVHVARLDVPEEVVVRVKGEEGSGVDLHGTLRIVRGVPGLMALIVFSCFNNFLGGTFMALMDAYGLSLVSVQAWGLLWGVLSTGFIFGGLLVAKTGLSSNPVRTILLCNLVLWAVTCLFPIRSSVALMAIGLYVYMLLVPYVEAAEQTVLQKVVPYERQGRYSASRRAWNRPLRR
jgi:DHA3 family multidrug efflux protein-like MFS transporter